MQSVRRNQRLTRQGSVGPPYTAATGQHPTSENADYDRRVNALVVFADAGSSLTLGPYLRGRGITLWLPKLRPAREPFHKETGRHFDAMVGLVERVGDGAVGVSITYLDETDSRKANIEPNKRFRGEINGGAVRLAEATPDDWLIIGEGIETVLSGMQMTGHPGRTAGAAMYEDAKLRTATGLSNLWDGEPIRRVCAGDDAEPTVISHRRLALHLMAQPEIAGALYSDRTIASQGLLSRALLTWPPTAMGDRKYQGPAPSSLKALARYNELLIALLEEASSERTKVWLT